SKTFLGGKTFMDTFREDTYAHERAENLYFPFALHEEWQFTSWLLCSRLSLMAINSLLLLKIFKQIPLLFCTRRQLHAQAETLPSGPKWVYETLPTKYLVHLFYCDPIHCLQALLSNPLLGLHISFVLQRIWTSAAKICHIYDEWLSGDQAWNIQDALPAGTTVLGTVLSSDKINISVITGNHMAHPV
ncbi:hypothetical protein J3A83DRAFT_4077707, partial [Scleroderma citrinum]